MSDQAARLAIENGGQPRRLVLAGEVDAYTCPLLEEQLSALSTDGNVMVDLSDVTFIDSSGLRVLVSAHNALEEAGSRLELQAPSEGVLRLLKITGLEDRLHLTME